jgi:hypothetical protein
MARHLGARPASTAGIRMAFEPLRGPTAPPLRSGFGVIVAAVVMLVAATVFGGSLTHLLGSKHLVGWNWDAILGWDDSGESALTLERKREAVAGVPGVADATLGSFFSFAALGPDRSGIQVISFVGGPIGPTMISGRPPRGAHEIVLGRETMSRLGARVGDVIPFGVSAGDFDQGQGREVSGEVTIVGTAVLPTGGGDNRLGNGGAVAFEFFNANDPDALPSAVFVRLAPGRSVEDVLPSISDTLEVDDMDVITEDVVGGQLLDVGQVADLPIVLAALLALLAVGVVTEVVVSSTHARRGELGVLRALGFRPRQIRTAIAVQAIALGGSALIVGIPLGIALGRAAWRAFALSLGTKPEVSVAIAWLAVLAVGLLVLASVLGLLGSARPRRQLAAALRRE